MLNRRIDWRINKHGFIDLSIDQTCKTILTYVKKKLYLDLLCLHIFFELCQHLCAFQRSTLFMPGNFLQQEFFSTF